jgi:hypothetical protein
MKKNKINPYLFLLWLVFIVFPTIIYSINIAENNFNKTSQALILFNFFIYGSYAWANI